LPVIPCGRTEILTPSGWLLEANGTVMTAGTAADCWAAAAMVTTVAPACLFGGGVGSTDAMAVGRSAVVVGDSTSLG